MGRLKKGETEGDETDVENGNGRSPEHVAARRKRGHTHVYRAAPFASALLQLVSCLGSLDAKTACCVRRSARYVPQRREVKSTVKV